MNVLTLMTAFERCGKELQQKLEASTDRDEAVKAAKAVVAIKLVSDLFSAQMEQMGELMEEVREAFPELCREVFADLQAELEAAG